MDNLTDNVIKINQPSRVIKVLLHSQVEWPLPAHLDLYQIVRPSSRRRKCLCLFQERDLTFLRVDPSIILLTSGSSGTPEENRTVRSKKTWRIISFSVRDRTHMNLQDPSSVLKCGRPLVKLFGLLSKICRKPLTESNTDRSAGSSWIFH